MNGAVAQAADFYSLVDSEQKMQALDAALALCFARPSDLGTVPDLPARGPEVLFPSLHPPKPGLSGREGQARLAHDLASIELQATELALRTLIEFPEAPASFREELAELARNEGQHFRLCLGALDSLGFRFGDWPVHLQLWRATSREDSLIDRVIVVHRYLEGAGLDASESLLRRLAGSDARAVRETVETIAREEVGHVAFGSRWLRRLCERDGLDAEHEFVSRLERLFREVPRRERLARDVRARAGFTEREMDALDRARSNPEPARERS